MKCNGIRRIVHGIHGKGLLNTFETSLTSTITYNNNLEGKNWRQFEVIVLEEILKVLISAPKGIKNIIVNYQCMLTEIHENSPMMSE